MCGGPEPASHPAVSHMPVISAKESMTSRLRYEGRPPADFAAFIRSHAFPCVGAKSALAQGALHVFQAGSIGSGADDGAIRDALIAFAAQAARVPALLHSFACIFNDRTVFSEATFEAALWERLQGLHDLDVEAGVPWAPDVEDDPRSAHFSMSVGGGAYFIIGMHSGASRAARRFSRPALIFNLHEQFERLRADGRYDVMKSIVRDRELENAGDVNPMLQDFGERGEAAQYSGRRVDDGWRCPLRVKS